MRRQVGASALSITKLWVYYIMMAVLARRVLPSYPPTSFTLNSMKHVNVLVSLCIPFWKLKLIRLCT